MRRSRELLNEVLDHWHGRGYASEETLLFGFSQGCLMTFGDGPALSAAVGGLGRVRVGTGGGGPGGWRRQYRELREQG